MNKTKNINLITLFQIVLGLGSEIVNFSTKVINENKVLRFANSKDIQALPHRRAFIKFFKTLFSLITLVEKMNKTKNINLITLFQILLGLGSEIVNFSTKVKNENKVLRFANSKELKPFHTEGLL